MIESIREFWLNERHLMIETVTQIKQQVSDIVTPVAIPVGVAATAHGASFTADDFAKWGSGTLCVLTSVHVIVMIFLKVSNFVEKKRSQKQERGED